MTSLRALLHSMVIVSLLLSTYPSQASEEPSESREAVLKRVCLGSSNLSSGPVIPQKSGSPIKTFYVKVAEAEGKPPYILDCTSVFKNAVASKLCPDEQDPGLQKLISYTKQFQYQEDLKACALKGTPGLSSTCVKELGCNVSRMALNAASMGLFYGASKLNAYLNPQKEDKSCLGGNQEDCLTRAAAGILKDLVGQVKGLAQLPGMLWDGAKWLCKGAANAAKSSYQWLKSESVQSIEDQLSAKMMAARTVTSSALAQFVKNPIKFMSEMMTKFINAIIKAITPMAQKAKLSLACATCNGMLNGVCEIMGYVGGEVVVAFFTGGTANLASKLSKVPKVATALEKINATAKATVKAASEYKVLRASMNAVKGGARAATVVGTKVIQTLKGIPGAKQYIILTEDAFMKGYLSKAAFTEWKGAKSAAAHINRVAKLRGNGTSQGQVSEYEKALIDENPEVKWAKLTQAETDAKLNALSGNTKSIVSEPKARALIQDKNYDYLYRELSANQQVEVAKLQKEVGFAKLSPEKQAEFMNRMGEAHWKGNVEVSKKGLTTAQYENAIRQGPDKILQMAKEGQITLTPNREKVLALQDFKRYLEKEHQVKNAFAAVDRLANQETLVLGELATGDARVAEKIAAQSELKAPNFEGKPVGEYYNHRNYLKGLSTNSPEGKLKLAEMRNEIEDQLEFWNAEASRLRKTTEASSEPGEFFYKGKTYSVEEKRQLRELLKQEEESARKVKKELDKAYSEVSAPYKPEKVVIQEQPPISQARVAEVPALETAPAQAAGKVELETFTQRSAQFTQEVQATRETMNQGTYAMAETKQGLEVLKKQKIEPLQFERKPGSVQSNEEVIYQQRKRTYERTQAEVEKAMIEVEEKIKNTQAAVTRVSEYTAYEVGRGGIIDQKIDYILATQKNPTSHLSAVRDDLLKDLKRINSIHLSDQQALFPRVDFKLIKTRIEAQIEQINSKLLK